MDQTEQTLETLPPDILGDIFLRLPVETLARLTLASYFFQDFITNCLVYFHLERAAPVVHAVSTKESTGERLTNEAVLSKFRNMKFSNPFQLDEHFALAGSYNGLVCFNQFSTEKHHYNYDRRNIWEHLTQENMEEEEEEGFRIYLWNPTLHEIRALPKPIGNNDFVAFGYDPSTQDYKILWISRGKRYKAEAYSWKNESWKIICKNFRHVPHESKDTYIVGFEGSLHWFSGSYRQSNVPYGRGSLHRVSGSNRQCNVRVSAFNIADERLDVYKVPEDVSEKGNTLGVLRGNLSLLVGNCYAYSWEIWLLDKSSSEDCPWTKTFQFSTQPRTFQFRMPRYHEHRYSDDDYSDSDEEIIVEKKEPDYIRGLTANGEIMVSSKGREEYDLVDPDTIIFEELRYEYQCVHSKSYFFIDYVETLISVYPPRSLER